MILLQTINQNILFPLLFPGQRTMKKSRFSKRAREYYLWKDLVGIYLRLQNLKTEEIYLDGIAPFMVFHIPMPKSWSKKKKEKYNGTPHQQKPDKDNYEKAMQDCMKEDSHIWKSRGCEKRWAITGKIEIYLDLLVIERYREIEAEKRSRNE